MRGAATPPAFEDARASGVALTLASAVMNLLSMISGLCGGFALLSLAPGTPPPGGACSLTLLTEPHACALACAPATSPSLCRTVPVMAASASCCWSCLA